MKILVIDAQGGGIGRQLISCLKASLANIEITAVGTNSLATSAMIKAGCDHAATGENAVKVCCRKADVIVGPIGIAIADSMLGEVTAEMAAAVGCSEAARFLIPLSHCDSVIIGVTETNTGRLVEEAVRAIAAYQKESGL